MLKLNDLIILPDADLKTAMEKMTANKKGALFVCDEENHLVGVISDGDIRRSLVDDGTLLAPVHQVMNTDPVSAERIEEAKSMLDRYSVVAIPILGPEGQVREIVVKDGEQPTVLAGSRIKNISTKVKSAHAIAIIPARGGSKRILQKNLGLVAGKPLVAWAILAAKQAKHVDAVVVSTDDPEIADLARSLGVEVPWLRPKRLAGDDVATMDVILHAIGQIEPNPPEIGVLLEPTAPLRRPEHIDQAVKKLSSSGADSVVSVCEVPHVLNPEELLVIEKGGLRPYGKSRSMDSRRLRGRQHPAYVPNGLVYAFRVKPLLKYHSLYGRKCVPLIVDWEYFLDVDTTSDLKLADFRLRQIHNKLL